VFFWPSVARLAKSELIIPCVELGNDDSGCALCVGLPLLVLFGLPV
jgi:hypothetical protein